MDKILGVLRPNTNDSKISKLFRNIYRVLGVLLSHVVVTTQANFWT
jgi:hypothetical protein